jgi:UPF0489 domain
MKFPDIDHFEADDQYFEEIFPGVWLMDDHRWAYYIWEKIRFETGNNGPYALVHLDCHWDGVNDFHGEPSAIKELIEINDMEGIYSLVQKNTDVRKHSFVAPAIIRGLVDEVHFYCKQACTGPGLYPPFLKQHKARQVIHQGVEALLSRKISKPVIFDIDLDLFNNFDMWDEGDLWPDAEITEFLSMCSGMVQSASVVTAAMSFGYSGTEKDTRHLTRLFTSFARRFKSLL